MATRFFYQKGPVTTHENWLFPTKETVAAFFEEYVPVFDRARRGDPTYELYFHGSCRDRVLGYAQMYEDTPSHDVDIMILTGREPDETVIYEAMCAAVEIGFRHRLLVDVCSKVKPYYMDYEDYANHRLAAVSNRVSVYRLNPIIKIYDEYYYENYIEGKKDHMVKVEYEDSVNAKVVKRLLNGWTLYRPTKILV